MFAGTTKRTQVDARLGASVNRQVSMLMSTWQIAQKISKATAIRIRAIIPFAIVV